MLKLKSFDDVGCMNGFVSVEGWEKDVVIEVNNKYSQCSMFNAWWSVD